MGDDLQQPAPARRGKIASLPAKIRDELCRRMHDGERGPVLLPWLNALPEVLTVLDREWGEEPITASNLSDWRNGGFQDYLRKLEAVERTKILADYCRKVGEAGASEFGLPAALSGGMMMEVMESFDPTMLKALLMQKPGKVMEMMNSMASLQMAQAKLIAAKSGEAAVQQRERALQQREDQLGLNERRVKLAENEFQRKTCELFIDWSKDEEARQIASNTGTPKAVRIDKLMKRMFGERPAGLNEPAALSTPSAGSGPATISGGG